MSAPLSTPEGPQIEITDEMISARATVLWVDHSSLGLSESLAEELTEQVLRRALSVYREKI